jgi:hypothetical protein
MYIASERKLVCKKSYVGFYILQQIQVTEQQIQTMRRKFQFF